MACAIAFDEEFIARIQNPASWLWMMQRGFTEVMCVPDGVEDILKQDTPDARALRALLESIAHAWLNSGDFRQQLAAQKVYEALDRILHEDHSAAFKTAGGLHTDTLESRYGQMRVAILRQSDAVRVVKIVDQQNIIRTLAITFFPEHPAPEHREIDQRIRAGASLGKAFRDAGYEVRKNMIDICTNLTIPKQVLAEFRTTSEFAKVRVYEFYVRKGAEEPIYYCTVAEMYSPDFDPPFISKRDSLQISAPATALAAEGIPLAVLWEYMGNGRWTEIYAKIGRARYRATAELQRLRDQIADELYRKELSEGQTIEFS